MTIFASAGHNPKGIKTDSGAVGNGCREADLAVEFRNLVSAELARMGVQFVTDRDDERLAEYLERIKTGSGSVVLEFHFDASDNPKATGCTSIIGVDADRLDIAFARELANTTSLILGVKNRGVKSEAETHRGRLGLMREFGTVCLLELCFISNINDLKAYNSKKIVLAKEIAKILVRYESLI